MKTRIISAAIVLLIFIPILLQGGMIYNLFVWFLSLVALKEFLDIKQTKKVLPSPIVFISYILITLFMLINLENKNLVYSVDFSFIAALFMAYLIPTVLYHDRSKYSINDAFFLIGGVFFLGSSFNLFVLLRNINLNIVIYILSIAIITDTYAYLTGMLVGKHKLLESISPKKTIEGMIGGTLFGTMLASYFYTLVVNPELNIFIVISITLFLSILGQIGDLVFSSIKRHFGKKDFSNLMPGHGGVLDRIDSIIFIALGFMFFIAII